MNRREFSLWSAALPLAGLPPAAGAVESAASVSGARTFSQVGKEQRPFVEQPEATLAEQSGSGFLDHMWFGGSFPDYPRVRLRVYVDGEDTASIATELGFGAGVGFNDSAAPWGTRWSGVTGAPSGIFLNYRIPFSRHLRVTAELPPAAARDVPFWWIIRGMHGVPLRVGDFTLPRQARLRLHRKESLHVKPLEFFDLCRISGEGMVFQVAIAAQSENFEYLEGQMRAYVDGASEPMMLSSGLEDYFLGTYYFNRGLYHLPQAGLTHKDESNHSFSAYRFHDLDPIVFAKELRLACRCGETIGDRIAGTTGYPQATVYTTYAWVYEW